MRCLHSLNPRRNLNSGYDQTIRTLLPRNRQSWHSLARRISMFISYKQVMRQAAETSEAAFASSAFCAWLSARATWASKVVSFIGHNGGHIHCSFGWGLILWVHKREVKRDPIRLVFVRYTVFLGLRIACCYVCKRSAGFGLCIVDCIRHNCHNCFFISPLSQMISDDIRTLSVFIWVFCISWSFLLNSSNLLLNT